MGCVARRDGHARVPLGEQPLARVVQLPLEPRTLGEPALLRLSVPSLLGGERAVGMRVRGA
ncbi:hypothetical protein T492DRAFT_1072624 [Pavlovales sp. CCMP2436]|nr:hypothetical protein T492DRAFT_1072624 [Pavlovales sp. CCMP2436]